MVLYQGGENDAMATLLLGFSQTTGHRKETQERYDRAQGRAAGVLLTGLSA
jgi:hypothetical protein